MSGPMTGPLSMRGEHTQRVVNEAEQNRRKILDGRHLINFHDLKAEWRYYRRWKAAEKNKPADVNWAQFYLEQRHKDLEIYLRGLDLIKQSAHGNVLVARQMKPYIESAELLERVYDFGLDNTYPDPQNEAQFYQAIDPMVRGAQSDGILAKLPGNNPKPMVSMPSPTSLLSPSVPPPVPMAPQGPPIATGIAPTPPQITWLESIYRQSRKPQFIGAHNQLLHARGSGWRAKSFAPLFHGIPWHLPETAPTGPGGMPGPGGDPSDDSDDGMGRKRRMRSEPYDINKELHEDPRPARVDFRSFGHEHHPEDYDDDYYKRNYRLLYDRTVDFAEKWFGDVDLPEKGYEGSPWQEVFNDQFIEYSRLVAHEDRHVGGWPAFLRQAKYRKWLIVGILGQIMEKKIFSDLLFGADDKWRTELELDDLRLLDVEGYRRKARRSETVKMALNGSFVPRNFFGVVDNLAFRTALIFEPLINLLDLYREFNNVHQTNERHFYQELHTLLTIAGYFQVCMALSPTPFHILSATPGARMDWPIERQAEIVLYRESKEVNEQLDAQWEEIRERLAKGQNVSPADFDRLNNLYPFPTVGSPTYEKEKAMARHQRLRGARVKIAVFPMLKRYRPENRGVRPKSRRPRDPGDWDNVEGQRIVEILRCTVVYYQGLIYPRNILEDGVPLDTHLTMWRGWERNPVRYSITAWTAIYLGISLLALFVVYLAHVLVFGTLSANTLMHRILREIADVIMFPRRLMVLVLKQNEGSLAIATCRLFCERLLSGLCVCTPGTEL